MSEYYAARPQKDLAVTYILWFFLGWLGIHRLYLGHIGAGVLQASLFLIGSALTFILIGYIPLALWLFLWIFDLFRIGGFVRRYNAGY